MGPLEPDWYRDWVFAHCRSFGIGSPDQIDVFLSWRAAMIGLGATAADLADCTRLVLMDDRTPEWPREHLAAVKRHLGRLHEDRQRKAEKESRERDAGRGVCAYCGDSGWVIVPYPDDVKGGTWQPHHRNRDGEPVHRTCAVACACPAGGRQHKGAAAHADKIGVKQPMSLGTYEARVDPAWREHLAEREEAARALVRAQSTADAADRFGRLPNIRKLLAGVGTPVGRCRP